MTKTKATLTILFGATCMSFAALFVRLVDQADGFQIMAYRSLTLALMVATMACLRRRTGPVQFLRSLDGTDFLVGLALAIAFPFYVFALLNTSVASVLFILSAVPFMAAVLAWVWIGERPAPIVWATMVLAIIGVGIMISDGFASGGTAGNIMALISGFFFAVMLVLIRKSKKDDPLGGTFLGGALSSLFAMVCAMTVGQGLGISAYDLGITLFMGAFTIGIGIGFVTWGTPYVPAAEVSLLVLIESVLSPIWVWVLLGEAISTREMIGGVLVLIAVIIVALARKKKSKAQRAPV